MRSFLKASSGKFVIAFQNTHWFNIELGCGWLKLVLWGHTLDQHHSGLRQVEDITMGTHAGSMLNWFGVMHNHIRIFLYGEELYIISILASSLQYSMKKMITLIAIMRSSSHLSL